MDLFVYNNMYCIYICDDSHVSVEPDISRSLKHSPIFHPSPPGKCLTISHTKQQSAYTSRVGNEAVHLLCDNPVGPMRHEQTSKPLGGPYLRQENKTPNVVAVDKSWNQLSTRTLEVSNYASQVICVAHFTCATSKLNIHKYPLLYEEWAARPRFTRFPEVPA
ncbi:hypothetical protein BBP40_005229 [Aspergillus hancockii]|nr:hypothetical protein BBP40_005229 [Aspergillus hancockii]